MTGFARAKEDRSTPPEVYNWRVYVASLIVSMGVMAYGYDSAFIGTTITSTSFVRDFGLATMSKAEKANVSSNLTSIYSAGGFFGAFFMFFSLELLGRKWTIILSDLVFLVGGVLCTAAHGSLGILYAGRLFTGFGVGGIASVCPTYIVEISPPAIRGRLTGFFESSYQIGAVIGFWINYGIVHTIPSTSSTAWHIPMAVQLLPAGLLAIGIPFIRESPLWLLKQGRDADALKVYSYFRQLPEEHPYIAQDVAYVKSQIEYEHAVVVGERPTFVAFLKGAAKEAVQPGVRNRFVLVFLMFMWQAWSGAAAINYYSPTIFKSIGLDDTTFWTGIYGIIKALGSIIFFTFFIDSFGRKKPWMISCIGCALCQFYLAAYIKMAHPTTAVGVKSASTIAGGKAATSAIMIFGAMWSFGANGLPWIISAEIFPSSLRSISGPWAGMSVWLWTYVVTKALPSMYTGMGYGVYIFFACMLLAATVYAYFYIHETKGLRLDQMDELFGRQKRASSQYVSEVGSDAGETKHHDDKGTVAYVETV